MDLSRFPRRVYTESPTPLEFLPRFSEALGGPRIYIKRDDLTGLTGGGNKSRKMEFIMGQALEKGCDTIITCGAVQSNSCRITLAAAIKEGLACRILLLEHEPLGMYDPRAGANNLLFDLLEPELIRVVPPGVDANTEMEKMAQEALAEGRKPHVIAGNRASARAALGHVVCAREILDQLDEQDIGIDCVVTPSGSGGTHGGLLTGFHALGRPLATAGINIRRYKAEQEEMVWDVVKRTSDLIGDPGCVPEEAVVCFDSYYQPGYQEPNPGMVEAVRLLAKTEGILLDPVYNGKAMAGLIDLVRQGYFKKADNLLFIHTGGAIALYVYLETFFGG
jgi:D-cysteine desulfhydrase